MASLLKPVERWLKLAVLPPAGAGVIRALGRSMKIETRGYEHVDRLYHEGKRVIIAFWHARQLMMPLTYRGTLAHILISQHQDGEMMLKKNSSRVGTASWSRIRGLAGSFCGGRPCGSRRKVMRRSWKPNAWSSKRS